MKKAKSFLSLILAFSFLSAVTFTSCGGKKEEANETETEQSSEHPSEHPSDSSEHPSEHPSDSEHPADTTNS
ncbi:hypothetical protein [Algoriphagus limi]|uniref:Uncharacterized protein n=1 Tax=Algoriphagus limi TaxID=2975273 RepID=A0ABT2G0Z5_9BACT|nr:hypothetical protein [Algoriphagus limi]MCS5488929.1 hypothetical protein [Algoriphagus limi]